MTSRMPRLLLLLCLSALLLTACNPRRGSGGGGGGNNPDVGGGAAETGPGKNVGDATSGGSLSAQANGSSVLYIVNQTGTWLDGVSGYGCDVEEWFSDEGLEIAHGEYLEVTGLSTNCWQLSAWFGDSQEETQVTSLGSSYTWVVGSVAIGDDDDAADDDDDVGDDDDVEGNVTISNWTEYSFYELVVVDTQTFEMSLVCEPFPWETTCTTTASGTFGFLAFTDAGRTENPDNCLMQSSVFEAGPGDQIEVEFTGGALECDLF